MKKIILCIVMFLVGAAVATAILVFLLGAKPTEPVSESAADTEEQAAFGNRELALLAFDVLDSIAKRDYKALASFADSENGVAFVPYSTVLPNSNKCFSASEIADFDNNTEKYIWGVYDGVGDPIELSVSDYFDKFVFDSDYSSASAIGLNYIIRSGNSLENVSEVYPDCQFVDFFVASPTREMEDVDWHILRLVFNGSKLIAVINSRYTV